MRALRWTLILAALTLSAPVWGQRVLFVPLVQNQGPTSTSWIGTGLAVALGETLTQDNVPTVPFEDLLSYYDQADLVDSPSFTLASQLGMARQIGAGYLASGGYEVTEESVAVHLQLYAVAGDLKRIASFDETQNLQELLGLTRKLSESLAQALGRPWTPPAPVSAQAFESYIRGRITRDPTLQEVFFRKALEVQPDYYDSTCYLALVLKQTGRISEATALLVGLENKTYSKAYLGLVHLAQIRLDQGRLPEARALILKSLKASESAEGHMAMAMWYSRQKKYREALTELKVAERFGTHQEGIDTLRRLIEGAETPNPPAAPAPPSPSPPAPEPGPATAPAPRPDTEPSAAPPGG